MSPSLTTRLLTPSTEQWDWQLHARCRNMGTDLFFSPDGETRQARRYREEFATRICQSCPVVTDCQTHAQAVREPFGIWGGTTESDRRFRSGRAPRRADADTPSARIAPRLTISSRHPSPGRQKL
ncbi:WhiB family transcriptional regulator [Rhodococcus sp. NPDC056960]|uniref:WhiB family transcriptional regulator n=1 Tax=Rhodococcus sp. NPDC056960 TaxID=3345982 RepID=UPI00363C4B21